MKYLLLIYGEREKCDSVPAEMWQTELARYTAFTERYRATGELLGAYGLADAVNAELVRRVDGAPADEAPVEVWPILHEAAADL